MEPRKNLTYFVLLGFTHNSSEKKFLFVMFLLFYILAVVGNMLIVVTITFRLTNVLLSCQLIIYGCHLFFSHLPQINFTYALWEKKYHIFQILYGSTFYKALIWWIRPLLLVMAMWSSVSPCVIWFHGAKAVFCAAGGVLVQEKMYQ